jgi:hypothetical protein
MLTLKNIRTLVVIGLAVLLTVGTAAGKNARASQRQAAGGQQRQAPAVQRQANNQAQRRVNQGVVGQQRQAQQGALSKIWNKNKAILQANRQAVSRLSQVQKNSLAKVWSANKAIQQTNQQAASNLSQVQKNSLAKVWSANKAIQQANQQAAAKLPQAQQTNAARNRGETPRVRNENRQRPTIDVKRNDQKTITRRNGNTVTKNINRTLVRNTGNRFDRPTVVRPYNYSRRRDGYGKSIRVIRRYPGRRPNSIFRRIVWRNYGYPIYYRHGPDLFVQYVRPAYHRKYVFVSFGTYWPAYYSNLRYYWYGLYPYSWYGCYPTAYEVGSDTYNYYTYNTYNYDYSTSQDYTTSEYPGPLEGVDEKTFEDVRQRLDQQRQQQPEEKTLTDKFFEDGVTAFEQEDYDTAAKAFADAIALEPNDLILPFAYVQALFASEQYSRAADNLRSALEQMPAEEQGLFFPRGLYGDDEILFGQIDDLQSKAETFTFDPDMSLLLGYQLIGVERNDEARQWLERASQFEINEDSAVILLDLLDKLEEQSESTSENNL